MIVLCIFTYLSAGGVVGAYFLGSQWGGYLRVIGDQYSSSQANDGIGVYVTLWVLYVS